MNCANCETPIEPCPVESCVRRPPYVHAGDGSHVCNIPGPPSQLLMATPPPGMRPNPRRYTQADEELVAAEIAAARHPSGDPWPSWRFWQWPNWHEPEARVSYGPDLTGMGAIHPAARACCGNVYLTGKPCEHCTAKGTTMNEETGLLLFLIGVYGMLRHPWTTISEIWGELNNRGRDARRAKGADNV